MGCGGTGGPFPFQHEFPPPFISTVSPARQRNTGCWEPPCAAAANSPCSTVAPGWARGPGPQTPRGHAADTVDTQDQGLSCHVALGLAQGKGSNDLARCTGTRLRAPSRCVHLPETRRGSPDPPGGAALEWGSSGATLAQNRASCGRARPQRWLSISQPWSIWLRTTACLPPVTGGSSPLMEPTLPSSSDGGRSQLIL